MVIHVVRPGDTLYSLSQEYGVALSLIALDNGLEIPQRLVVGQALVIRFPRVVHTVQRGETLSSIAREYDATLRQLYQNNPVLKGQPLIWPRETVVISYYQETGPEIGVNAYAYPYIDSALLSSTLPFLTFLTPFTYGFTPTGALVPLNDARLIAAARTHRVAPLMHLSTLTQEGGFSNELAHLILNDWETQATLITNIIATLREKGYRGLDVDFEYVFPEDAAAYAAFLGNLTQRLNPLGYPVIAALAPKTSADQRGALYEGHDFAAIGAAVNEVFLMTYEWYILTHRPKSVDIAGLSGVCAPFLVLFRVVFSNTHLGMVSYTFSIITTQMVSSMSAPAWNLYSHKFRCLGAHAPKTP